MDHKGEAGPFLAMAAVEFINVGLNTLFKASSEKGLSNFVLTAYANAIGALALLPFVAIFPRTGVPSLLNVPILGRFALFGCGASTCAYLGIEYTSPTIYSVISNLTPALTFVFAVAFRMETLELGSRRTWAKIVGTVVSTSGAIVTILYKGPTVMLPAFSIALSPPTWPTDWVIGGLFLVGSCFFASLSFIIQTQIIKLYPNELTVAAIASLFTSIVAGMVGAVLEKNQSAWALQTDMALLTVVLTGVFGPSLATAVHTWGLNMKGPVYVTIFRPFSIVIAAAMGVLFLHDLLYLGSLIGATIIMVGFYAVIWGKTKDKPKEVFASDGPSEVSSDNKTPLLL